MMEPAFAELGLDWRYLTVEVRPEDLAAAVRGARRHELAQDSIAPFLIKSLSFPTSID